MMTQEQRLHFLINYLLHESERYSDIRIPNDINEQKNLFRALVNLREPKDIAESFITIQNAYLKQEIKEKGMTDGNTLPFVENKISLWQGDITTLQCSAIVNAANSALLGCFVPGHTCIDNAIHTFSGVQLRMECAALMQQQGSAEKTGKAKMTGAYNLPCDYVLHTVGPIVDDHVTEHHRDQLAACYRSCLSMAEKNGIQSIAFPCISTGEFRFPHRQAAEIAVYTVRHHLQKTKIERVIFNVFKDEDREMYETLLG